MDQFQCKVNLSNIHFAGFDYFFRKIGAVQVHFHTLVTSLLNEFLVSQTQNILCVFTDPTGPVWQILWNLFWNVVKLHMYSEDYICIMVGHRSFTMQIIYMSEQQSERSVTIVQSSLGSQSDLFSQNEYSLCNLHWHIP